jgi:hypothetical protein
MRHRTAISLALAIGLPGLIFVDTTAAGLQINTINKHAAGYSALRQPRRGSPAAWSAV